MPARRTRQPRRKKSGNTEMEDDDDADPSTTQVSSAGNTTSALDTVIDDSAALSPDDSISQVQARRSKARKRKRVEKLDAEAKKYDSDDLTDEDAIEEENELSEYNFTSFWHSHHLNIERHKGRTRRDYSSKIYSYFMKPQLVIEDGRRKMGKSQGREYPIYQYTCLKYVLLFDYLSH